MHRFLTLVALAVMLLPVPATVAVTADGSEAGVSAQDDLSGEALKVNINTDDARAIAAGLTGIGQKRAEAIVRYREANGPFHDASELADVEGIGTRTVQVNADRIEVD